MKYLLMLLLISGCSSIPESAYLKVGAGYKLQETNLNRIDKGVITYNMNDPLTARFELGAECFIPQITCGVTHHSQWLTGKPFNDKDEYSKTEIFIDYKFKLSELFN